VIDLTPLVSLLRERSRPELIDLIAHLYTAHAQSRQALVFRLDTRTRHQLQLIALLMCCVDQLLTGQKGRK